MSSGGGPSNHKAGRPVLKRVTSALRRWLSHPPLGVGLAIVALLALTALDNHYRESNSADYPATQEQGEAEPIVSPGAFPQGIAAQNEPADEKERTTRDLYAQEDMAEWAFWMVIVSAAGVLLIGATLHETWKAGKSAALILDQTRRQADIADDTAKLELRARLSVLPAGVNALIKSDNGMGHVALRNVGKLPARNVWLEVRMRIADWRETAFAVEPDTKTVRRDLQPGTEMEQGSDEEIPVAEFGTPGRYVFVWGVAYYEDGYGCRRFTRFCHRYATASRNRNEDWNRQSSETRVIIDARKARFHTEANEAN